MACWGFRSADLPLWSFVNGAVLEIFCSVVVFCRVSNTWGLRDDMLIDRWKIVLRLSVGEFPGIWTCHRTDRSWRSRVPSKLRYLRASMSVVL
mmetsp:Transcript_35526/g.93289  ORF Transcript_35526/g.93289 Transcript_35526/m.93289 type:complete len:93 (+) Transcript_35526:68-346(+)